MLATERRKNILGQLQEEKWVEVSGLSRQYDVSEETIRRDLGKFEEEGLVTRSYGGAALKEDFPTEIPFKERKKRNMQGKRMIGELLTTVIEDGDHILLDPSTTAVSIVKALRECGKKDLTIITNSIEVLVLCAEDSDWKVISTGGTLQGKKYALVGPQAIACIESYHVDKAIISCKGFDIENGPTDSSDMVSQVKRTMLENATKRILAVDCSKFDNVAFSRICGINDIDLVVTDEKPSDAWLEYLESKGIECQYEQEDKSDSLCE